MTKNELSEAIGEELKMDRQHVKRVINSLFDKVIEIIEKEKMFEIRGFGTFELQMKRGKRGSHPKTRQMIFIGPKNYIKLHAGEKMMQMLKRVDPAEVMAFWSARRTTKSRYDSLPITGAISDLNAPLLEKNKIRHEAKKAKPKDESKPDDE